MTFSLAFFRAWDKTTGAMLSVSSTLASTERRVAELQKECDAQAAAAAALAERRDEQLGAIASMQTRNAGYTTALAQSRAALGQAQAATTARKCTSNPHHSVFSRGISDRLLVTTSGRAHLPVTP